METDDPEHYPSDDDPDESSDEDKDQPEAGPPNDSAGNNQEPPFHPIEPSDLGLPPDPEMGYIPTEDQLRAAAVHALDDISALFILHPDDEQVIAAQLDNIASVLLAASQLKGPHQAKAVRLGLHLNHHFWQTHNKETTWLQLIVPLLNITLELGDKQLQAEAYRAWGIYLYTSGKDANQPKSARAFQIAMEYATESGRDDLKLLARIEHFNQQIRSMSEQDMLAEAHALITDARRLQNIYFEGRVYASMARFYFWKDHCQLFQYAQQAMIIFWNLNDYGLFCQCIIFLVHSLEDQTPHAAYRQQLLGAMEQMASHLAYPYISASLYHLWAVQYYKLKLYQEARSAMIRSCVIVRRVGTYLDTSFALHMLGLIEMRRHRWQVSRLFLEAALQGYEESRIDQAQIVQLHHALAFIPFEQRNFAAAYTELGKVLEMAQALPPGNVRDSLIKLISDDRGRAKQAMESD